MNREHCANCQRTYWSRVKVRACLPCRRHPARRKRTLTGRRPTQPAVQNIRPTLEDFQDRVGPSL